MYKKLTKIIDHLLLSISPVTELNEMKDFIGDCIRSYVIDEDAIEHISTLIRNIFYLNPYKYHFTYVNCDAKDFLEQNVYNNCLFTDVNIDDVRFKICSTSNIACIVKVNVGDYNNPKLLDVVGNPWNFDSNVGDISVYTIDGKNVFNSEPHFERDLLVKSSCDKSVRDVMNDINHYMYFITLACSVSFYHQRNPKTIKEKIEHFLFKKPFYTNTITTTSYEFICCKPSKEKINSKMPKIYYFTGNDEKSEMLKEINNYIKNIYQLYINEKTKVNVYPYTFTTEESFRDILKYEWCESNTNDSKSIIRNYRFSSDKKYLVLPIDSSIRNNLIDLILKENDEGYFIKVIETVDENTVDIQCFYYKRENK